MFGSSKVKEPLPTKLTEEEKVKLRQFLVRQIKECQEDDHENIRTVTYCITALKDLDDLSI